ncbi:ESPR domain-containing protein [Neisseria bergeri]|uniref:ESPR domain-containing protein n=1 Tax=Neisseria bergeri TaxID=1906581 RepID=UPI0027E18E34|nr:ESPR domain-containing protein [Neisseria bergeri]
MNKIFRVIYSQATQSWVAVSELTKAHKKQSSSNAQKNAVNISGSVFKSSVIALGLLSGANTAYAVNTAGSGQGTAVAWGLTQVRIQELLWLLVIMREPIIRMV